MVKKRGLGKTLDALLARNTSDDTDMDVDTSLTLEDPHEKLTQLAIAAIEPGKYQPRRAMEPEALEELASSIRAQGIIQPIVVRPVHHKIGVYEIIAGERRWRAAQLAGLETVPTIIKNIPDEAAIAIALIENIQRENLNPIEEAIAFERLMHEFEMTHQEIATAVGKSRTSVTNLLRLLSLPEEVKSLIDKGKLEMGHARTLITLPSDLQLEAAEIIVNRGLSVRETEHLVRRLQSPNESPAQKKIGIDLQDLQEKIAGALKMRVALQCNAKGKGKLVIHYKNLRELDTILDGMQLAVEG